MKDDPKVFETVAGETINLKPISLLDLQRAQDAARQEFVDRNEPIDPPTYRVEQLGYENDEDGPREEYNFKTILDAPEEDKALWAKHIEALNRLGEERQRRTAIIFAEGADIELPDNDNWIKRQKNLFNIDVPDDPDERKVFYLNRVLLKTPKDKDGFQWAVYSISMTGATEEAIQAMERLFWSSMAIGKRPYSGSSNRENEEPEEQHVVLQPGNEGRAGSGVEGNDAQAIQTTTNGRSGGDHSTEQGEIENAAMGELPEQEGNREE